MRPGNLCASLPPFQIPLGTAQVPPGDKEVAGRGKGVFLLAQPGERLPYWSASGAASGPCPSRKRLHPSDFRSQLFDMLRSDIFFERGKLFVLMSLNGLNRCGHATLTDHGCPKGCVHKNIQLTVHVSRVLSISGLGGVHLSASSPHRQRNRGKAETGQESQGMDQQCLGKVGVECGGANTS